MLPDDCIETPEKIARIRELNDAFRTGARPALGRILLTSGARNAVAAWPLGQAGLYFKVKEFTAFNAGNDPHGEHDFGSFEFAGEKLFWKIDYFDKALEWGSDDPSDPEKTARVLTIMLAAEY